MKQLALLIILSTPSLGNIVQISSHSLWAGANQPAHYWFLGGMGLDIQQGTSVWVGSPKSSLWPHQLIFTVFKISTVKGLFVERGPGQARAGGPSELLSK